MNKRQKKKMLKQAIEKCRKEKPNGGMIKHKGFTVGILSMGNGMHVGEFDLCKRYIADAEL